MKEAIREAIKEAIKQTIKVAHEFTARLFTAVDSRPGLNVLSSVSMAERRASAPTSTLRGGVDGCQS